MNNPYIQKLILHYPLKKKLHNIWAKINSPLFLLILIRCTINDAFLCHKHLLFWPLAVC